MSMDDVGIEDVATEVERLDVSREPARASSCTSTVTLARLVCEELKADPGKQPGAKSVATTKNELSDGKKP